MFRSIDSWHNRYYLRETIFQVYIYLNLQIRQEKGFDFNIIFMNGNNNTINALGKKFHKCLPLELGFFAGVE